MAHELTFSEIHQHHSHLIDEIRSLHSRLVMRASTGESLIDLRDNYANFLTDELIPHAVTEEETIYLDAAREPDLESLVSAMTDEHRRIVALIDRLRGAKDPDQVMEAAGGFLALLEAHFDKEDRLLLPALNARGRLPD
jgi:iron-sulfur cluster repair protein YtfE (RIC family)